MSERKFNLSGASVFVGIPSYGDIPPQTVVSLVGTALAAMRAGVRFGFEILPNHCYVDQARCFLAQKFLQSGATHYFQIDADVTWAPEMFLRVLAHATVMECVAGAYRLKTDEEAYPVNLLKDGVTNTYGCVPATGMGLGFCCVQRKVIQKLAERAPRIQMGSQGVIPAIYRCDYENDNYRGEDIAFFSDVMELGYTPWLDLGVQLGHVGRKEYKGSFLGMLQGNEANQKAGAA